MFDIGWTEMLVIAVVMIVVVGPKDLPRMLRTFGKTTAKLRSMAGDFQKQFNEALKEAELDDVKKSVDALRGLNPTAEIRKQLNPFEKAAADVRAGLDQAMKPTPSTSSEPAVPVTHTAEPLKPGPEAFPGVAGPDAMPATPVFPAMTDASIVAEGAKADVAKAAPAAKSKAAAKATVAPKKAVAAKKPVAKAVSNTPVVEKVAIKPTAKSTAVKPVAKAVVKPVAAAVKAKPAPAKKPAPAAKKKSESAK